MIPPEWLRTAGEGVRVGVIDTGVSKAISARVVAHRSFVPTPVHENARHGTEIVRVIASNDPVDEGIAPRAEVVYAKAIEGGHSTVRALTEALFWLASERCLVINMSFAMPDVNTAFKDLVAQLETQGIILVASYAAGMPYPHSLPGVIQVGVRGSSAQVSTSGTYPSVRLESKVGSISGSSVSTAIVSGVAACAKAFDPLISRSEFLQRLQTCFP